MAVPNAFGITNPNTHPVYTFLNAASNLTGGLLLGRLICVVTSSTLTWAPVSTPVSFLLACSCVIGFVRSMFSLFNYGLDGPGELCYAKGFLECLLLSPVVLIMDIVATVHSFRPALVPAAA